MKSKCAVLFLLSGIIICSPVFSTDGAISLNDAISISLQNNNRYKTAKEKVHEKDLRVREVWGELWPEITSGASVARWGAEKGTLTGNDGQYNVQIVKGSLGINPGVFKSRLESAREERIITVNDERRIKADTTVNTIQLYYRVLLTSETVKLRLDSVKALDENLRGVEAGYKNGSYTRLSFLRAGVAAANERTRLINAEKDYKIAMAALNIQLGREIDSPLVLKEGELVTGGQDESSSAGVNKTENPVRYDEMVAVALKNRPELLQLNHKKNLYNAREMESKSVYLWPSFFISGSYGANKLINPKGDTSTGTPLADSIINGLNSELNPPGWNRNWNISAGATYRWGALSPADSSGSRAGQFRSMSDQTDMELEDFVRNVRLDVQDGLLSLEAASHSIQSQKGNIRLAEESFRVAAIQFKNGVIDNTDLLNANVELSSAKTLYIQSLYDFQTSKARLNRVLGCDYFSFGY